MKKMMILVLFALLPALGQTRDEAEAAIAEVEEMVDIVREIASESSGEELLSYIEKKLEGHVFPQVDMCRGWLDDPAEYLKIMYICNSLSEFLKQLISYTNKYIRAALTLERNLDAIERAEEMISPDNYLGMNQIQGAWHFYNVHAMSRGLERAHANMANEAAYDPPNESFLQNAIDQAYISLGFVQKAMAIAREEYNARRFL
jgi:hypothetical protein